MAFDNAVAHDDKGRWKAGHSGGGNVNGYNQYNSPRLQTIARIDLAVEKRFQEVAPDGVSVCAQEIADQIVTACMNLDAPGSMEIVRFFLGSGPLEQLMGRDGWTPPSHDPEAGTDPWEAFEGLPSDGALEGERALNEVEAGPEGAD